MNPSSLQSSPKASTDTVKLPSRRLQLWRAGKRTEKIALLFTILYAGQMYGMEPMKPQPTYHTLPQELQKEIVTFALATNKSIDNVINAIKAFGTLHGVHYDTQTAIDLFLKTIPNDFDKAVNDVKNLQGTKPEDFTKLVHILANKFNRTTMNVANMFNSLTAQQYKDLVKRASNLPDINILIQLIKEGLDVNATYNMSGKSSLLIKTVELCGSPENVKLLLDAGANPHCKNEYGQTALYWANVDNHIKSQKIRELLEEAMKK